MKRFYSCIDGSIPAPQPVQHMVIRERASKAGGAVIFYGAEDVAALGKQPFIRLKATRLKQTGLDGIIFYTLDQFRYSGEFNYGLLLFFLDMGLEIVFAVENLTIKDRSQLQELFPFLTSIDWTSRRDRSGWWRDFVQGVGASN